MLLSKLALVLLVAADPVAVFTSKPGEFNEMPERIRLACGLAGKPSHNPRVQRGEVVDTVYWLRLKPEDGVVCLDLPRTDTK